MLFQGSLWEKRGEAAKLVVRPPAGAPRWVRMLSGESKAGAGWVRKEQENHVIVAPTHPSLIPLFQML